MSTNAKRSDNMVGERILRNFEFLNKLAHTNSIKKRWPLVERATRDELLSIVEICANILSSDFVLTKAKKKRLMPFANLVRALSRARSEKRVKTIIKKKFAEDLNQKGKGAFLTALLAPVLIEAGRMLYKHFTKQ